MKSTYLNPYLAGFFLGLTLLATIVISGRGLGASGGFKGVVAGTVEAVAPAHAAANPFYSTARTHGRSPLADWLVFEVTGVALGAFLSGLMSSRLRCIVERGPRASARLRLLTAALGGALFSFGAQFGRGCTSGAALSGMAVLSAGGMLTMGVIFGSAFAVAWFFRKLWI